MRRGSPRRIGTGRRLPCLAAAVVAGLALAPALAQERGQASATGSDSLTLNGQAYRLFGIDGLAFDQSCFVDGQPFACGVSATRALQTLLATSAVECTPKGAGRALCTGAAGDIALDLVTQGWAVADPDQSDAYGAAEAAARAAAAGAWRGSFLAPGAYRALVAAVETRYGQVAAETVREAAEMTLGAGTLDLRGLVSPPPQWTAADDGPAHELRLEAFAPGAIGAAIPAPGIFAWPAVAAALETQRQEAIGTLAAGLAAPVWQDLAARPARTVETADAETFYAALLDSSAAWRTAGRQPLLYVMAPDLPAWVRDWFAGRPPAGAVVSRRAGRDSPAYLGTIDGIDVYLGPGRERAALLVPADLLAAVTYRRDAAGRVLALAEAGAPGAWTVRYAAALDWRDDPVVWLAFPRRAAPTPDAG